MNDVFGEAVAGCTGTLLVLDDDTHPPFGTSRRLVEHHGVDPTQLCIVQADPTKAAAMKSDQQFGPQVVQDYVHLYLQKGEHTTPATHTHYAGMYLDLCGSWTGQLEPALQAVLEVLRTTPTQPHQPFILGVTWCTRDAYGQPETVTLTELQQLLMQSYPTQCIRHSLYGTMRTHFYKIMV